MYKEDYENRSMTMAKQIGCCVALSNVRGKVPQPENKTAAFHRLRLQKDEQRLHQHSCKYGTV